MGKAKENQDHQCQTGFGGGKTGAGSANKEITAISVRRTVNMQKSSERRSKKGRHASAKRGARTKLQLMEDDYGFVEGI